MDSPQQQVGGVLAPGIAPPAPGPSCCECETTEGTFVYLCGEGWYCQSCSQAPH
jgi:hypothetical protein